MRILMAMLAAGAAATGAAGAPTMPPVMAAAQSDADRLAGLLLPGEALARLATRALDAGFEQRMASDPAFKARYAAKPALKEAVAARLGPELSKLLTANLPALRTQIAAILSAELTPDEIAATADFFASPTGQKLHAKVYATIGEKPGASEAEIQQAAMASVMGSLTADDYPALIAFGASPAAAKMKTLNPKIAAASKAWGEALIAKHRARFDTLREQVEREFGAGQ